MHSHVFGVKALHSGHGLSGLYHNQMHCWLVGGMAVSQSISRLFIVSTTFS